MNTKSTAQTWFVVWLVGLQKLIRRLPQPKDRIGNQHIGGII
jgi:hypothetical protein